MKVSNISYMLVFSISLLMLTRTNCERRRGESFVPKWVESAIWYQIFPERFRNGDTNNDPELEDIRGSWPHDVKSPYKVQNWTSDWYKLQHWEDDARGFYYHVQRRRYGGDIQGIIDKLDYLQELGVNAFYLNPVFESPSLHKYDAASYHHIDDNFGPNPQYDKSIVQSEDPMNPEKWQWTSADTLFLQLIKKCHDRDMKIIIDGVFNHVGLRFWAFEDLKRHGINSKFKNWFTVVNWDDPATEEDEFDYKGWMGVRELPEIREDGRGIIEEPRNYIKAAVQRWMDPNCDGDPSDGIDGWRLDVAEMVSKEFWREFRKWVKDTNPQVYLTGEIWWEDWMDGKMFNPSSWLQGDMFDAVMNYRFADASYRFFLEDSNKIQPSELARILNNLLKDNPVHVNHVMQNLYDSHDTERLASMVVNPGRMIDHESVLQHHKDFNVRKPNQKELRLIRLLVLFQMTYVGTPMIYYGDEVGMWGADDPDCRKPMVWNDMEFDPETEHPFKKDRTIDSVSVNKDLLGFYRTLIHVRKELRCFNGGKFSIKLVDDEKNLFGFIRKLEDRKVFVIFNTGEIARDIVTIKKSKWEIEFCANGGASWKDNRLSMQSQDGVILLKK